ncbi:MAG: hypothetical protein JST75_09380 [Bacteroidetes bacterium]|nr:hypothetical protein [Bacteroidota bacterium]
MKYNGDNNLLETYITQVIALTQSTSLRDKTNTLSLDLANLITEVGERKNLQILNTKLKIAEGLFEHDALEFNRIYQTFKNKEITITEEEIRRMMEPYEKTRESMMAMKETLSRLQPQSDVVIQINEFDSIYRNLEKQCRNIVFYLTNERMK